MLQRQGVAPPWVAAQGDLNAAFAAFRESLRAEWLRYVTRQITTTPGSMSAHISLAKSYVQRDTAANFSLREYKTDWESREREYHSLAIEDLNAKIRSYNTVAPYSARKAYTTLAIELESCYKDVAPKIVESISDRKNVSSPKTGPKLFVQGITDDFTGQRSESDGEYGLKKIFKGLLKWGTR